MFLVSCLNKSHRTWFPAQKNVGFSRGWQKAELAPRKSWRLNGLGLWREAMSEWEGSENHGEKGQQLNSPPQSGAGISC